MYLTALQLQHISALSFTLFLNNHAHSRTLMWFPSFGRSNICYYRIIAIINWMNRCSFWSRRVKANSYFKTETDSGKRPLASWPHNRLCLYCICMCLVCGRLPPLQCPVPLGWRFHHYAGEQQSEEKLARPCCSPPFFSNFHFCLNTVDVNGITKGHPCKVRCHDSQINQTAPNVFSSCLHATTGGTAEIAA